MNQVGETRVFSINPAPAPGAVYSYVWDWWDGTTDATDTPWASKTLNQGGQPGAGGGLLHYTCTPVSPTGQNIQKAGSLQVNNPPTLIAPAVVTANDQFFPYNTTIQVRAFDFDGDALIFEWYDGGTFLGNGSTTDDGNVTATWKGNGTSVTASYLVRKNSFSLGVTGHRLLTLKVTDGVRGGVTQFQVELRGSLPPPAVLGGAGAGVSRPGQTTAMARVGPDVDAVFELYAKNPTGGPLSFSWNFAGTHNWTVTAGPSPGVVTGTADGGQKTLFRKDISVELFPDGVERKTVVGVVTVSWPGGASEAQLPMTLLANHPLNDITFKAKVNGQEYPWGSGQPIEPGSVVEFSAESFDPDLDIVTYEWVFIQPQGATPPQTLRLWGATVVLETNNWPSGSKVEATVTARDFGSEWTEVTLAIPIFSPSSASLS